MRIFRHTFVNTHGNPNDNPPEMGIIVENPRNKNPQNAIDQAVADFVNGREFSDYVEEWLDDPWLRLVICGISSLNYEYGTRFNGIATFDEVLPNGGRICILFAHPNIKNPKPVLDNAVMQVTNGCSYNAFVEHTKNYPYVRIVIWGLNNLWYDEV
jgi:hypothetical protein